MSENGKQNQVDEVIVISNVEEVANSEVAKFKVNDALIENVKKTYMGLRVENVEDKKEVESFKKAKNEVVKIRTTIEKKRKELVEPYNEVVKQINGEAKRIIEAISPVEEHLKLEWNRVEKELEAVEKRAEIERAERLNKRIEKLISLGAEFDGTFYVSGTVSVDVHTVANIIDEDFERLSERVKSETERVRTQRYDDRVYRINQIGFEFNEETRYFELSNLKIDQDLLMNQTEYDFNNWFVNVTKQILDLEQEKRRQEQEEQERKEREAKQQALKMRIEMLKMVGLTEEQEGLRYVNGNDFIFIPFVKIEALSDADFFPFVNETKLQKESIDEIQEGRKRLIEIFNERSQILLSIGFIYNSSAKVFEYKSEFGNVSIDGEKVAKNAEEAFADVLENASVRIEEIKAKEEQAEKERLQKLEQAKKEAEARAEAERIAKLSDFEKVNVFAKEILQVVEKFNVDSLQNEEIRKNVILFNQSVIELVKTLEK